MANTVVVPVPKQSQLEPEAQPVSLYRRDNLEDVGELLRSEGLIDLEEKDLDLLPIKCFVRCIVSESQVIVPLYNLFSFPFCPLEVSLVASFD